VDADHERADRQGYGAQGRRAGDSGEPLRHIGSSHDVVERPTTADGFRLIADRPPRRKWSRTTATAAASP
jgi:hypothetical protein